MDGLDDTLKQFIILRIFLPFIPLFVAFGYFHLPFFDSQSSHRLALVQPFFPDHAVSERRGDKGNRQSLCLLLAAFAMTMIRTGIME
jgi:hypothetical protein